MLSSAFAVKNISGRPILEQSSSKRAGSFPTGTDDFAMVNFTRDELDDAQMVWWLLTAYFPHLGIAPRGTRSELVLAMRLLVCHLRECGGMPPAIDPAWGYYRRRCTDIAYQRMGDLIDGLTSGQAHHPESHEWGDAPDIRHRYLLAHLTPLLEKLSDDATVKAQRRQEDYDLLEACHAWGIDDCNNNVSHRRRRRSALKYANAEDLITNDETKEDPIHMLGTFRRGGSRRWWGASWPVGSSHMWFFQQPGRTISTP